MKFTRTQSRGFTLVEMLVVAPIVILAIGAFLTVIISMTGEVIASRASNALSYNVQDALNRIEQDVKQSTGFLSTTNIAAVYGTANSPLTAAAKQGYNDSTTDFTNVTTGTTGPMLILNMIATTKNPLSTDSTYVYLKDKPNDCSSSQGNIPLTYNVVYFIKGTTNTLWRRTILPTNYLNTSTLICSQPWQQPSCSTAIMDASSSAHCKAYDVKLVDGVDPKTFAIQYYSGESTNTVNALASNTSLTTAQRNTSLQSATTVAISINAVQNGGGREVSRAATLRVSRLDTNATSITIPTTDGVPAAPTIAKSSVPGAKAKFTWPSVPGATGYTIDYNINGGAWTNVFTNQNTRTATISSNVNKDTINVRVLSVGAAGSSSYATSSVVTPMWDAMEYEGNWNNFGAGYVEGSYTKTASGAVFLRGLVKKGAGVAATQGEVITTLPEGYRPAYIMYFAITASGGDSTGAIRVDPNGDVIVSLGASGDWTSFSRISFIPSDASYTWTNLTPVNSYVNRNNPSDPPYSYTIDSAGRGYIRGALNAGTSGANISSLPASMQVSPKIIYATRSGGNGYNDVDIGTVVTHRNTAAGSAIYLNMMYVPDSASATWTKPTLSAGWSTFSSANAAEGYTKSSDGVVTLRGLIKGGTITNGTVLFTLPAGYRPTGTIAFISVCNGTPCRVDVSSNGNVLARGFDANWSSLAGVSFVAEQ